jgi:hypothetical protein
LALKQRLGFGSSYSALLEEFTVNKETVVSAAWINRFYGFSISTLQFGQN